MQSTHILRVALLTGLVACASSSSSSPPGPADAAADAQGREEEAGVDAAPLEPEGDAGSGTTWTDLYRDLFGPGGRAACGGAGCHEPNSQGAVIQSGGFECTDKASCRTKLLDAGLVKLPKDASAPRDSTLVKVLRKRNDDGTTSGIMPKRSSYVFGTMTLGRIETWIAAGAKDD